jgi:hypothetical protein
MTRTRLSDGRIMTATEVDLFAKILPERQDVRRAGIEREGVHPFALNAAAKRLDEAQLVEKVVYEAQIAGSFKGPAWEQLSRALWIYAWSALRGKIRTGEIIALVKKYDSRSFTISPDDLAVLHHSPDERSALALDTILKAIPDFQRNALAKGGWSSAAGACLTTYFLGTCALKFRRTYQEWSQNRVGQLERLAAQHHLDLNRIGQQVTTAVSDVACGDPRLEVVLTMLNHEDRTTRLIYGMRMRELTYPQIGAELGLSASAVEARVYRFNLRVKHRVHSDATGVAS